MQELISVEGRAPARSPLELLDLGTPTIRLEGIVVRYGSLLALDGLDLEASAGEVVGLLGPNGSGKTTALRVASGLVRPTEGKGSVCGFPVASLRARERLAFVPDEPSGLDELTVSELVELLRALYRKGSEAELRAAALVERLGLDTRLEARLSSLSKGLRRRAAIVACLALATPVVLLDEAAAALDPWTVEKLVRILRDRASDGGTVLLATQDLEFAYDVCDRVVVLDRGRTLSDDTSFPRLEGR